MGPWIAAPLCLSLLGLAVYCHRNWLAIFPEDPPGTGRHHHAAPTPMAGFVPVLVAVGALAYAEISWWIIGGVTLASLTGYLDDRGKAAESVFFDERPRLAERLPVLADFEQGAASQRAVARAVLGSEWCVFDLVEYFLGGLGLVTVE